VVTGLIYTIRDKGFGLISRQYTSARARGAERTPPMATGTITSIRGRGFGFIAGGTAGDRRDLFFHRAAVAGDGFDGLREGQRVRFDEELDDPRDRTRQRAVNIRPADGGGAEGGDHPTGPSGRPT
jgi:cold shock CspA family protein